jgi:murein DD-endopeptidase MepM/ murein hydrolase activator NlpD
VTDLLRGGSASFLEGRPLWGRAGSGFEFAAAHRRPVALGAAAIIGIAASAYIGIGYVRYEQFAAAEQAAVMRAERANADLQDAVARLRDQVAAANQALNTAQSRIAALSDETKKQIAVTEQAVTSKADRIAQLTHALEQAQRELHLTEAQRVTLMARLSKADVDLTDWQARQQQVQAGIDQWQKKVQQLTVDRDKAASERDHLRARVSELEQKHSMRQAPRPVAEAQPRPAAQAPAAAAAVAAPATPAPASVATAAPVPAAPVAATQAASAPVARAEPERPAPAIVAAVNRGGLAQVERVLASAGVDVAHLFSKYGMRTGEGGPFIPVGRGQHADNSMSPEKLAALQTLVKMLPVSAPLGSYEIGSGFGVRGDPINGRASYHTGLDFRAPYMSPVYATAAGVVTYSGYRDDYGKIVEIDHGNGIATRYAHLHRQTVSVGQRVAAHTQIGFLGSTGRATGPHVHYEVLVNGEPQNPEKFLGLARVVAAVQQ